MKAFVLFEQGKIGMMDKPEPKLKEQHGVLLRPLMVSPCTSDVHTIWQGSPKKKELTLGHECVAEVIQTGTEVQDFKAGDHVIVPAITPDWSQPDVEYNPSHAGKNFSAHMLGKSLDGCFAEQFYLPFADKNLAHLKEGISLKQGLMCADVMSTGFTAAQAAEIKPGDSVLVYGIGAIGLMAVAAAKLMGAGTVYAVGSRESCKKLAKEYGADYVIDYKQCRASLPEEMHPSANYTGSSVVNEILTLTHTKGVDRILICGGGEQVLAEAVDMVKYGTGIVVNVSYFGGEGAVSIPKFSIGRGMAGKTLKFELARGGRDQIEYLSELIVEGKINPEPLVSVTLNGFECLKDAIELMKDKSSGVVKVAVELG